MSIGSRRNQDCVASKTSNIYLARVNPKFGIENSGRMPKFKGAVIDTGAARSCIGKKQAVAYAGTIGHVPKLSKTNLSFRFGDKVEKSCGAILIKLPIGNGMLIEFYCDIVPANIPLLLGLDILKRERLIIDVDLMELRNAHWSMKMNEAITSDPGNSERDTKVMQYLC